MNLERTVKKLNVLLRQELGDRDGGVYGWKWSESLTREMDAINDDGTPIYDYLPSESGLLVAKPRKVARKMCLNTDHQWVLCKYLIPPLVEEPTWFPCDPIYLDRGVEPDAQLTWQVITSIRRQRSAREHGRAEDSQLADALQERDRKKVDELQVAISDARPAFLAIPGKKEHVSFPTVEGVA